MSNKRYTATRTFTKTITREVTLDEDGDLFLPRTGDERPNHEYLSPATAREAGWTLTEHEDPADYQYWTSSLWHTEKYVYRLHKDQSNRVDRGVPLQVSKNGKWINSTAYTTNRSFELQQLPLADLPRALDNSSLWQASRRVSSGVSNFVYDNTNELITRLR